MKKEINKTISVGRCHVFVYRKPKVSSKTKQKTTKASKWIQQDFRTQNKYLKNQLYFYISSKQSENKIKRTITLAIKIIKLR